MNEMIEKLKKNEKPFGLLSPEEQECFEKVGCKNCLYYDSGKKWHERTVNPFFDVSTYRIKPDYKPKPEFVDLEIIIVGGWLGVQIPGPGFPIELPYIFTHLHCLPSLQGFQCFWEEPKGFTGYMLNQAFWTISLVSPKISEGKKVFARFRKEKPCPKS